LKVFLIIIINMATCYESAIELGLTYLKTLFDIPEEEISLEIQKASEFNSKLECIIPIVNFI